MASFITFNEGKDLIGTSGWPATTHYALSRSPIAADPNAPAAGELNAASAYANRNEPSWTGVSAYARISTVTPAVANGIWTFTTSGTWLTGAATDGQADIVTFLMLSNSGSKLICAESLAETTMSSASAAATAITIAANPNSAIAVGTVLQIGAGASLETKTVSAISGTSVTLSAGLTNNQSSGARILVRADMSKANSEIVINQPFHRFLQNVGGN